MELESQFFSCTVNFGIQGYRFACTIFRFRYDPWGRFRAWLKTFIHHAW